MSLSKIVRQVLSSAKCQHRSFQTTARILATEMAENPLFVTVNSPFIYTEFDVNYHRQAVGLNPKPVLGPFESDIFTPTQPHTLFGLIPAEFSVISNMKRLAQGLKLDLSTLRLNEHFVRFKEPLPGCGTLICRTRLRDVHETFTENQTNILVEVELWSSEADLSGKDFLSFSQFNYSCMPSSGAEAKKKFSSAAWRLQSPLLDYVADTSILIEPGHANMNHLSKIGNENRLPRDPYMLALCSWKQEQVEGMGLVTFIVENILKEYDVDQSKVSADRKSGV